MGRDWPRIEFGRASEQADFKLCNGARRNCGDQTSKRMSEMLIGTCANKLFDRNSWQIDRMCRFARNEICGHILGNLHAHSLLRLLGRSSEMGSHDHGVELEEVRSHRWLLSIDIESRTREMAAL